MDPIYGRDLAYIHAAAFGDLARGAAPEVVRRLTSAGTPIRRVVEAGCGAGALTALLIEAGFEVTGIDPSTELLSLARGAAPAARFVNASIYDVSLPECEAIVAVGEPLTYHAEGEDADRAVRGFFRRAAAALPGGGMLIFDVIETGEPPLSGRSWRSGEDWAVLVETRKEQAARVLVRAIETFRGADGHYRRGRETHRIRLFDTDELVAELAGCGFRVETAQAYGAHGLAPRRRAFFCTRL